MRCQFVIRFDCIKRNFVPRYIVVKLFFVVPLFFAAIAEAAVIMIFFNSKKSVRR